MTRARNDYQREYMAKRRAESPVSRKGRMAKALRDIDAKLSTRVSPLSVELRAMIAEALT